MNDIKILQETAYNILEQVTNFCIENDIRYYLSSGTLLGAVRHKGFIPWDDDIDIDMPIEDYLKFVRLAQTKFPKNLFAQTYSSDKAYSEMWCQVRLNNTTSLPVKFKNWNIHWGIHIDIFPLIGVYNSPFFARIQKRLFLLNRTFLAKDFYLAVDKKEIEKNMKLKIIYMFPRTLLHAICKINEKFIYKTFYKSNRVARIYTHIDTIFNRKDFDKKNTKLKFEEDEFYVPFDWDKVLTIEYGDYMELPPVEDRGGHESQLGEIINDTERDYHEYL